MSYSVNTGSNPVTSFHMCQHWLYIRKQLISDIKVQLNYCWRKFPEEFLSFFFLDLKLCKCNIYFRINFFWLLSLCHIFLTNENFAIYTHTPKKHFFFQQFKSHKQRREYNWDQTSSLAPQGFCSQLFCFSKDW